MSIVGRIVPSMCSMSVIHTSNPVSCNDVACRGRSVISRDHDTIVTSNLVDGIDWYSLSRSKLIFSSKVPVSKSPSALPLAYVAGDDMVIVGGLSGQAYIVDSRTSNIRQRLDHNGVCNLDSLLYG